MYFMNDAGDETDRRPRTENEQLRRHAPLMAAFIGLGILCEKSRDLTETQYQQAMQPMVDAFSKIGVSLDPNIVRWQLGDYAVPAMMYGAYKINYLIKKKGWPSLGSRTFGKSDEMGWLSATAAYYFLEFLNTTPFSPTNPGNPTNIDWKDLVAYTLGTSSYYAAQKLWIADKRSFAEHMNDLKQFFEKSLQVDPEKIIKMVTDDLSVSPRYWLDEINAGLELMNESPVWTRTAREEEPKSFRELLELKRAHEDPEQKILF